MAVLARIFMLSIGGVLGVNARYWMGVLISRWAAAPWATFAINISGAFIIGVVSVVLTHWLPHPHARLLIVTGFLGGYTTFSTLAYESAELWERGVPALAILNLAGSAAAGLIAALLGLVLARELILPAPERPPAAAVEAGTAPGDPAPGVVRLAPEKTD